MKWIGTYLLLLILVIVLSGCGGSDNELTYDQREAMYIKAIEGEKLEISMPCSLRSARTRELYTRTVARTTIYDNFAAFATTNDG